MGPAAASHNHHHHRPEKLALLGYDTPDDTGSPNASELYSCTLTNESTPSLSPTCSLHDGSDRHLSTNVSSKSLPPSPTSLRSVGDDDLLTQEEDVSTTDTFIIKASEGPGNNTPAPGTAASIGETLVHSRSVSPDRWKDEFVRIVGHLPPCGRTSLETDVPQEASSSTPAPKRRSNGSSGHHSQHPIWTGRLSKLGNNYQPSPLTRNSFSSSDESKHVPGTNGAHDTMTNAIPHPAFSVPAGPASTRSEPIQNSSSRMAAIERSATSLPGAARGPVKDAALLDYLPFKYSGDSAKRSNLKHAYLARSTHVGLPEDEFPLLFQTAEQRSRSLSAGNARRLALESGRSLPSRQRPNTLTDRSIPKPMQRALGCEPNYRLVMNYPEMVDTPSLINPDGQQAKNSYFAGYVRKRSGMVQYFIGSLFAHERWILEGNAKIAVGRAQMHLAMELKAKRPQQTEDQSPDGSTNNRLSHSVPSPQLGPARQTRPPIPPMAHQGLANIGGSQPCAMQSMAALVV
ncbi:hypothetical protein H4R33_006899 [Dimargaris cristalligena]|nr:hypothetical protein H4R33_006899 [Dimargaris cristalligena]